MEGANALESICLQPISTSRTITSKIYQKKKIVPICIVVVVIVAKTWLSYGDPMP